MKTYVPDYYFKFSCLAEKCRHTCCAGWEIDIDNDTYELYQNLPENEKESILPHISVTEGTASINLCGDGRCPFLNENGLCKIIISLGDGAISDICYDHPRFRNYFSDRTELGIGMCCEAAGNLIINNDTKYKMMELEAEEDDEEAFPLTEEEMELFEYRNRLSSDHTLLPEINLASENMFSLLSSLETLLPEWKDTLKAIGKDSVRIIPDKQKDNIIDYLLFRHLPSSLECDYSKEDIALFCAFAVHLIRTIYECSNMELTEICRQFSSEIEYSDENVELIISFLKEN